MMFGRGRFIGKYGKSKIRAVGVEVDDAGGADLEDKAGEATGEHAPVKTDKKLKDTSTEDLEGK